MRGLINQMPCIWGITAEGISPHYPSRAIIEFIGVTLAQVVDVEFEDSSILTDCVWVL
ncbi:unnamed protein product, partial [Brassica rapa subsp. trilocularis]